MTRFIILSQSYTLVYLKQFSFDNFNKFPWTIINNWLDLYIKKIQINIFFQSEIHFRQDSALTRSLNVLPITPNPFIHFQILTTTKNWQSPHPSEHIQFITRKSNRRQRRDKTAKKTENSTGVNCSSLFIRLWGSFRPSPHPWESSFFQRRN